MTKVTMWLCTVIAVVSAFGSLGVALLAISQHQAPASCSAPAIAVQQQQPPASTPITSIPRSHERYVL